MTVAIISGHYHAPRLRPQLGKPHYWDIAAARAGDEQHVSQHGSELCAARGRKGPNMNEPLLKLTDIDKSFGPIDILHDISLEVHRGEVLCPLGDNGAGNSTLSKILSGVHKPTSGTIEMEGRPAAFASPREASSQGIATVHQFDGTFPLMSIGRSFFVGAELTKNGVCSRSSTEKPLPRPPCARPAISALPALTKVTA